MTHLLWRIEGTSMTPDRVSWHEGLILHLLFQTVTTIVVRRDGATRHYLALEGCPHCRPDGCERVCHRTLFAQLIRTSLPGIALTPVVRLAARATETRRVAAVPRRTDAQLLETTFLSQWQEGRLVTTWSRLRAKPQPIRVGALLLVGADGPEPSRALHTVGWRADVLASLASRRAVQLAVPPPVRVGSRASEALFATLRDPRHLCGPPPALVSEDADA